MDLKLLLIIVLVIIWNKKVIGQDLFPCSDVNIKLGDSKKLTYNDLFSDFEFILPIEQEGSFIDYIEKMIVIDGKIMILDRRNGQGDIKIFNQDGIMEKKITFPSEGPFSLTRISDFNVCGNQITVFDNYQRKIIKLDEDYQAFFEQRLDNRYVNFACGEDYYVFFMGLTAQFKPDAYLHFYKMDGNFVKKELKMNPALNNTNFLMEEQNFAPINKKQILFFHSFNQEIFSLDKAGIQSVLNFKLAEWIPDGDIEKFKAMSMTDWTDYVNSQESVIKIMNVLSLEKHLFFTVNFLGNRYWVFYSFESKKIKSVKLGYATDKAFALYTPFAYDNGNFYFLADPNTFLNFYNGVFERPRELKGNINLSSTKNNTEQPLIVKGSIKENFLNF